MSSADKNLSEFEGSEIPSAKPYKIAIVYSEWNNEITNELVLGAKQLLLKHDAKAENIILKSVPGSFELTLGSQYCIENDKSIDAVIAIGVVIQGETKHFDFICHAVSQGITQLNMKYNKPVIFGILTTNNSEQAVERSGGKHGNKGEEAAVTALKMLRLRDSFK